MEVFKNNKLIGSINIKLCGVGIHEKNYEIIFTPRRFYYNILKPKPISIGGFNSTYFPGCKGIIIFNKLNINEKYRGIGIGSLVLDYQKQLAIDHNCNQIQFTVRADNTPMNNLAIKKEFILASTFYNKKTNNHVNLYIYNYATKN